MPRANQNAKAFEVALEFLQFAKHHLNRRILTLVIFKFNRHHV
jgi:hypothetical protein